MSAPMIAIRVSAAAYTVLRSHGAWSTPGARHRDGSYTLAVYPELLKHLATVALVHEKLPATILRVLGPEAEPVA